MKSLRLMLLFPLYWATVSCEDLTIDCSGVTTRTNAEVFGSLKNISALTTVNITCAKLAKNITFIIFQAHSYRYNLTLYEGFISKSTAIVGTNLGMYGNNTVKKDHTYSLSNHNNVTVQVYISVHGYVSTDPIPGGCNMESLVKIEPSMHLKYTSDLIQVEVPAGQVKDNFECGIENKDNTIYLEHTFYRLYLTARDFGADEYFHGIRSMITLESVLKNGEVVPELPVKIQLRKFFSLYPGTGSIYVVVLAAKDGTAVYVPTHTYGCGLSDDEGSCNLLTDPFSQFVCATMFFSGLFVCYFGHRFFKTEMFLVGLSAGAIVTYIVITLISHLDQAATVGAALISGVFFGAIWWLFWWFYGMPAFSVMLATSLLGFVVASVVFFGLPDGIETLTQDINYWMLFILMMLTIPVLLLYVSLHANILCCAVLGAFATVYPIDYYIGTNLKYIMVNTVRRAVVKDFAKAMVAPPFQWRDVLLTLVWIMLAVTGFLFQKYQSRGKAPFPPPPRSAVRPAAPPPPPAPDRGRGSGRLYGSVHPETRPRSYMDHTGRVVHDERTPLVGA